MVNIDVQIPLWKGQLFVMVGGTVEELELALEGWGYDMPVDGVVGKFWFGGHAKPFMVWVRDFDIPVLVHELEHAVFMLLDTRGLKHCDDSEEAYTYTVEALLRQVLKSDDWALVRPQ
jgi:hypothetical protein